MKVQEIELQEKLSARQRGYITLFTGEFGKEILADLTAFCRGKESTFHPDQRVHAVLEGRREVYLRIMDHLELTAEDFLRKYGNLDINPRVRAKELDINE